MKKILFFLLLYSLTFADIFHVPSNEYSTIQEGIDAAQDRDTVLVDQGIYNENIKITRSITLASNALFDDLSEWTSQDVFGQWYVQNAHIDSTIIDGITATDDFGSTILIYQENDECITPRIFGFTIQNGLGTYVQRPYPTPEGEEDQYQRIGGGILFDVSNPIVEYNQFLNNGSTNVHDGGAIYGTTEDEDWTFDNIPTNYFNSENNTMRCDIEGFDFSNNLYNGNDALYGNDFANKGFINNNEEIPEFNMSESYFHVGDCGTNQISPVFVYIDHEADVDLSNFESNVCANTADSVYVDPTSTQECIDIGCGTQENPFQTIMWAMQMIMPSEDNTVTIHLEEGIYSPTENGEIFPIIMIDNVNIEGDNEETTILDAEQTAQVIVIENCENNIISKLTSKNGATYNFNDGAGVYFKSSEVYLSDMIIKDNISSDDGGAICMDNQSIVTLSNVQIFDNISNNLGGGIWLGLSSSLSLISSHIYNNFSEDEGGGIWVGGNANVTFQGSTISNNQSILGGGIYIENANLEFEDINSNIYLNQSNIGNDLYTINENEFISVNVDTFTVLYPSEYHAFPRDKFEFTIQDEMLQQVGIEEDTVFVSSTTGSNNNDGTLLSPLESIQYAISALYIDSNNPKTIKIEDGIYSPSSNNETLPLPIISNLTLMGDDFESTIIDGEYLSNVISMYGSENSQLISLSIINGLSDFGGGIYSYNSSPNFIDISVRNNEASSEGGGLYFDNSSPIFTTSTDALCSIYSNVAPIGKDIVSFDFIEMVLDTFTVLYPTNIYAYPIENFEIQVLNSVIEQTQNDMHISSMYGNDATGDGSEINPFATITHSLSIANTSLENPLTLYLSEGVFGENEDFPIYLIDNIQIIGEGPSLTKISADQDHRIFKISNNDNISINNLSITDGSVGNSTNIDRYGGAIYLQNASNIVLNNIAIYNNSASGEIGCTEEHGTETCVYSLSYGGAIYSLFSQLDIINCTITKNELRNPDDPDVFEENHGSAIYAIFSTINIYNSISWNNNNYYFPNMFYSGDDIVGISNSNISIYYSNIEDGWEEGEGNINIDPLFVNPENYDYSLEFGSPCIDTGTADIDGDGEDDIIDFFGSAPDMGAFELWILLGDLYPNGILDIVDIIAMVNMVIASTYNPLADMNSDGMVNIVDILALINIVLDN